MSERARSRRTLTPPARCARAAQAALLLLAVLAGCDRNIEPYQPGEEPRSPDLARIFPGPAGIIGSANGASGETGGGSGSPDRAALPPSRAEGSNVAGRGASPPAGGTAATGPAGSDAAPITGRIELAPELASARPAGGVLFVIARPQGARGGPPLAVLRVPDPTFPLDFSIGPANVMIPSMRFAGPVSLSARLDADGNAMTRGASDISSAVAEGLEPGTGGVRIVLAEQG